MSAFDVVLLAAGGSSRAGTPKQLLSYVGQPLVVHCAQAAIDSGARQVIVVVGADAQRVTETLKNLPLRIVENKGWGAGMGSSIRLGVEALEADAEAVVIALADQPKITPSHLRALGEKANSSPIVASEYAGVFGAPCAFSKAMFDDLKALEGDQGARPLLRNNAEQVVGIPFEDAACDIDTPEDYRKLSD